VQQVALQGVCLVVLSFFRDAEAAAALADTVAAHNGVLGAAVCCAEDGGKPQDDWTTCEADRDMLLDRCLPSDRPQVRGLMRFCADGRI
jgi:hypothetical protein